MALTFQVNFTGALKYLLGWKPREDDIAEVMGDSRIAYLDENHPFVKAGTHRWHDKVTEDNSEAWKEGWEGWRINRQHLYQNLAVAKWDMELVDDALQLYWQEMKRLRVDGYYKDPE